MIGAVARVGLGQVSRRRWSVLALGLLTALAIGVALAAIAGARRSVVVVDEVFTARRQPDVMSIPAREGFDWDEIVSLPYVEAYGLFASSAICVQETGGLTTAGAICTQPPIEGGWYDTIWRYDLADGRRPTAADEVLVTPLARAEWGWDVGDRLHLEAVGPERLEEYWEGDRSGSGYGPTFEVRVVGVGDGADAWVLTTGGQRHPGIELAPAFMAAHADEIGHRVDAFLRLRGGEADVGRLYSDVARITGDATIPVRNIHDAKRRVERSLATEASALWLFAGTLGVATVGLVGQALVRLVRAVGPDARVLRSLGMPSPALMLALAAPGAAVGALGALGAPAVALVASRWFPIGMARSFDRQPGMIVDEPVLIVGLIGTLLLVTAAALASAGAMVRQLRAAPTRARRRLSSRGHRVDLPVQAELGVRLALERRPGGQPVPAMPTLVGMVVGVAAVTAAFTFRSGIDDATTNLERSGVAWDHIAFEDISTLEGVSPEVLAAEGVQAAAVISRWQVQIDDVPVPAYTMDPIPPELRPIVLDGRFPGNSGEVAVGPETRRTLGVEVGDTVTAGGSAFDVVGLALLPEAGGHSAYDEGMWITVSGAERANASFDWRDTVIRVRDGEDVEAVTQRLGALGVEWGEDYFQPAGPRNLSRTRELPLVLGTLLVALAVGTVGNGLVTTVRRRQRDLAVLRVLGMPRHGLRAIVAWYASTVAALGLLAGVPLGVLIGRAVWRSVAIATPVVHVAPLALTALLVTVPATIAAANLIAWAPARRSAGRSPAQALRAE